MSEPLRIALVAEGATDFEVLKAAIEAILGDSRSFDLKLLQPDTSAAFELPGHAGALGGGWRGVWKWCAQPIRREVVLTQYDLLIIHLDADVATETDQALGLPCQYPCPPPDATTNELRRTMLTWIGEPHLPDRVLFCTPSKSIEAWVMEAFFPNDSEMRKRGKECNPNPESRLAQQPKSKRFSKTRADYRLRAASIAVAWPRMIRALSEARRFQSEFEHALPRVE